jgi:hypothetical protein
MALGISGSDELHVRGPLVVTKVRQEKTMKSKVMYRMALIAFASICAVLPSAAAQFSE